MNEEKTETTTTETETEEVKFRLRTIISDSDVTFLREESEPVSPTELNRSEIKELIQALKNYVVTNDGLGMAAVQLGVLKRIFVMRKPFSSDRLLTVINPRIIRGKGKSNGVEGCFSVTSIPDSVQGAIVRRRSEIFVEFTDEEGNLQTEEMMVGMDARIFQHELDHLDGFLMLDDSTPTGEFRGWKRSF